MRNAILLTATLVATALFTGSTYASSCSSCSSCSSKSEWVSIFNGKDLDGWTPKIRGHELGDNYADTFRVEDGLLTVSYDGYESFDGKFGHLFYKTPFSHYRLRIEYRFIGEQIKGGPGWAFRNSGIMAHCQAPESMDVNQSFPVSIEVQMLGGSGKGDRSTGNLCTPGTNVEIDGELVKKHVIPSKGKTYHGDQWVTLEVEVQGSDVVRHIVEGEVIHEYRKPQLDPKDKDAKKLIKDDGLLLEGGYFSLQAESHPVQFRKVEIMPLPGNRAIADR